MTAPIQQPSWLPDPPTVKKAGDKLTYTYIMNIHPKGQPPRQIAVEFVENAKLSPQGLATRELAQLVLLKSMQYLEKRLDAPLFKEGTMVELLTDKEKVTESTKSNLAITWQGQPRIYYDSNLTSQQVTTGSKPPAFIPLDKQLAKLDEIRKRIFHDRAAIDILKKKEEIGSPVRARVLPRPPPPPTTPGAGVGEDLADLGDLDG